MPDGLYDTDFHAWALEQAAILRRLVAARVNSPLDLEHLAEEVEDLGKAERAAVESLIELIIIHLLKLACSPVAEPRKHWRREVEAFRIAVAKRLRKAPSIRGRLDLAEIYGDARELAALAIADDGVDPATLPAHCPYTLDQVLGRGWWPANAHGLE